MFRARSERSSPPKLKRAQCNALCTTYTTSATIPQRVRIPTFITLYFTRMSYTANSNINTCIINGQHVTYALCHSVT